MGVLPSFSQVVAAAGLTGVFFILFWLIADIEKIVYFGPIHRPADVS